MITEIAGKIIGKKGFSLLETMVALAVLMMAITGPLTLGFTSIKASALAKNNLIAANLAQEGLELVKAYKMNNVLFDVAGWLTGMDSCYTGCSISFGSGSDLTNLIIELCPSNCVLYSNPINGIYTHDNTGNPTIFKRQINISNISAADEVKVTVTVSWNERFGDQKFAIDYYMQNW